MTKRRKQHVIVAAGVLIVCGWVLHQPISLWAKKVLHVPFSTQIPNGAWVQPFADACEETSMLMVEAYYRGQTTLTTSYMIDRIKKIVALEDQVLGFNKDTSVEVMTPFINNYFSFEARLVADPTEEEIIDELHAERPVIVPVDARKIPSPYYQQPAPSYHVFVLVGVDEDLGVFYAHDPGTRAGEEITYKIHDVMNAIQDYPDAEGVRPKRVIVTSSVLTTSARSDGDKDGLTKIQEQEYKTDLLSADTDGDGYPDGREVASGYSPIRNESAIKLPALIRLEGTARVYRADQHGRQYVTSPSAMRAHNWSFADVINVSPSYFSQFAERDPIRAE